jgi:anti-sigma regulatory factor (Ser/Thr protein kinase)
VTTPDELLIRLWPTAQACTLARNAVREFCSTRDLADVAYDAELLTSEVVSNAIRHSDGMLTVLLVCANNTIAVAVSDNNPHVPSLPAAAPDVLAESGRGLTVLSNIAGDWGMSPGSGGKTVWFRVP